MADFPSPLREALADPALDDATRLRLTRAWVSSPADFQVEYASLKAHAAQTAATLAARSERSARRQLDQTAPNLDDEIKRAIIKVMVEKKVGATEAAAIVGAERAKP